MSDLIKREDAIEAIDKMICDNKWVCECAINSLPTSDAVQGWIPLLYDDNGLGTNFPYERDGEWVIVTDGKTISVERIKKDVYDHFFPNGRWFELEDVIAWQPLPQPYKGGDDE